MDDTRKINNAHKSLQSTLMVHSMYLTEAISSRQEIVSQGHMCKQRDLAGITHVLTKIKADSGRLILD